MHEISPSLPISYQILAIRIAKSISNTVRNGTDALAVSLAYYFVNVISIGHLSPNFRKRPKFPIQKVSMCSWKFFLDAISPIANSFFIYFGHVHLSCPLHWLSSSTRTEYTDFFLLSNHEINFKKRKKFHVDRKLNYTS